MSEMWRPGCRVYRPDRKEWRVVLGARNAKGDWFATVTTTYGDPFYIKIPHDEVSEWRVSCSSEEVQL